MSGRDCRTHPSRASAGFTLIELTIAILILALIALITFRGISSMINARELLTVQTRRWYEISVFFAQMENDLSQFRERKVRNRDGVFQSAFIGKQYYEDLADRPAEDANLMFTRAGIPDQVGQAADLKRIGYRLKKNRIEMLLWPTLDLAPDTYPTVETVLEGVRSLKFRYWSNRKIWVDQWPDKMDRSPIPRGIEVTLELESGEKIRRLFSLWQGAYY